MRNTLHLSSIALATLISCDEAPKTVQERCEENVRYGLSGVLGSKIIAGARAPGYRTCIDSADKTKCEALMQTARESALEACKLMSWGDLKQ